MDSPRPIPKSNPTEAQCDEVPPPMPSEAVLDIIGIGVGPANLSLAALLADANAEGPSTLSARFFDSREEFGWHPGQLLPRVRMQSSIIRDLVSLIKPTSTFSFLAFLKQHHRLLQFLNAGQWFTTREEFTQYMSWVASQLSNISFGHTVKQIRFNSSARLYEVQVSHRGASRVHRSRNIVLGTGHGLLQVCSTPYSSTYRHASSLMSAPPAFCDRAVAVIGGGQSAAEVVQYLLDGNAPPRQLVWLARQWTIPPLNTGNFARELFTPAFSHAHFSYTREARESVALASHTAETGISPALLEHVYQLLYYHKHISRTPINISVLPGTHVTAVSPHTHGYTVASTRSADGEQLWHDADLVISCVGFGAPRVPAFLVNDDVYSLRLENCVRSDYSVAWGGPRDRNVYVQSMAAESHGVSDRHFTMIAHRSATIINAIAGKPLFVVDNNDAIATWGQS